MPSNDIPTSAEPDDRIVAILGYHKVGAPSAGAWETWYYVPEPTFVAQLSCLRDDGWSVIDVATFLRGLEAPANLPPRAALITFDDGYRSVLKVALPCLLRFGYPAVHFVPTDFIGGRNKFDGGAEPEEPICDWDELRELERQAVAVQAHSASHRHFSTLGPAGLEEELTRSKQVLEDGLGRPVEVFAFPYGDDGIDPQATGRALRRAGYRAACLYGGGPNRLPVDNPYRLRRLAMGPDTDLRAELGHVERHSLTGTTGGGIR
jgi:peptidoglycan/xylan/chitin deacetylase (PgdA/CDA1 family)